GQTSGGTEDLSTLTALSSVVSSLVQKVNTLETKLSGGADIPADVSPSADVPTSTTVPSGVSAGISEDVPSGVAHTGPSTVSPG
ncbi:hypothetical protein Tco_0616939, partial [Tanacetum coccineum]